jgi:hypothetical protein
MIFFVINFSLLFFYDHPRHDADVLGPPPENCLLLFVEMMLIPAKGVIVIAQCLELPQVCST